MSDQSKGKVYTMLETQDLDFIVGGAAVKEEINNKLLQTSCTQQCNCGMFEPTVIGVNLNICDNCKNAQAPYLGSVITYCSKQIS